MMLNGEPTTISSVLGKGIGRHNSSADSKYEFAEEVKESGTKEIVANKGMQLSYS